MYTYLHCDQFSKQSPIKSEKRTRKMTSINDIQEKTHPEPSVSHSGPSPELKKATPTLWPSALFRNPFCYKSMAVQSSPGKLPAFLMITTLLCLATLGAASPLINPEEQRPAEVPPIAPDHPAYHPAVSQPHHESGEEGEHQPEQPAHHISFPRPRREFREKEHRPSYEEHRPEGQHHAEEHQPEGQYPPEQSHTEETHHPKGDHLEVSRLEENHAEEHRPEGFHPEVHIRSSLLEPPAPLPAGAYTPSTPCPPSLEGQWNCMLTSWQRCGSGIWSAVMPTAKGTQCAPGGIAHELKTVLAPDYPPSAKPNPDQPQLPRPQGNTDGWAQGLPPRYSEGGRLGVSMGLAIAGVVVVVVAGLT
ncbi:hypothetical protein QC763_609045 [Podospora pseudopauciseta]|uniref:Uncharacterized protein n=1 Tax=Podospora pseudopauciseta TaxID=2093780 RepID=A0ABR0H659_9PEZI|nr:hypothetical protein QC763_609045 [Podospora pseudopauciseta]